MHQLYQVSHLPDIIRHGHRRWDEWPLALQLPCQELDPLLLIPVSI